MHERLSFFVKRDSALHRLNPLTKIILALSIIFISLSSPWYWTGLVLLLAVIVPLSFVGKVSREYFSSVIHVILPCGVYFPYAGIISTDRGNRYFPIWVPGCNPGKFFIRISHRNKNCSDDLRLYAFPVNHPSK